MKHVRTKTKIDNHINEEERLEEKQKEAVKGRKVPRLISFSLTQFSSCVIFFFFFFLSFIKTEVATK